MVFRLTDNVPRVTRHDLADPNRHECLEARLVAAGAPDLRDNAIVVDAGEGYVTILPKDASKRWTASSLGAEIPAASSASVSPQRALDEGADKSLPAPADHEELTSSSRRQRRT
jgi:hypothetical protein